MDTQIYLGLLFLLICRPGEILVCKLEGTSFWEKTPGAYLVSHCFTLPEGNCNDCIRKNDRSVEGKL